MAKGPTKAQLIERLEEMERTWLPRITQTIDDPRNEPDSTLHGLTADRVHACITSAERGDTKDLFSLYRDVLIADTHLQAVIETRFLAVLGDDPTVLPPDPENQDDVLAANAIRDAVDRLPDFLGVCADLLWGNIWPLSVVERTYKEAGIPGLRYDWNEIVQVPDHLFRWTNGYLEIEEVDPCTHRPNGRFFRPETNRYITHRGHLLRTPDNWGGPMRSLVWWFFLGIMDRDWWVRFLDKFGAPFMVGKFDKNDERSRQILERAFKLSTKIGGLVVNKETQVELMKTSTSDSAGSYKEFHQICNDQKSVRVLGQTLSVTASPTGIGSGASDLQGQVRGDICAWDKKRLAQTIRNQLFKPWLRLNGFTGRVPLLVFGGEESEEVSTTAEVLGNLKNAGIRLSDKSLPTLSKRVGLELERDEPAAPATPPGAPPQPAPTKTKRLSAPPPAKDPVEASQSISREAAAALTQAFRGTLAPVRQIILESTSPEDAETKLLAAFADWSPTKAAEVIETALVAGAWNGTQG
jgi:phage gp29-like protein